MLRVLLVRLPTVVAFPKGRKLNGARWHVLSPSENRKATHTIDKLYLLFYSLPPISRPSPVLARDRMSTTVLLRLLPSSQRRRPSTSSVELATTLLRLHSFARGGTLLLGSLYYQVVTGLVFTMGLRAYS
jgi:hypothetical protein